MTISVTDHYVLGASKLLSFQDEDAFDLSAGTPSIEIRGAVSVLGEQNSQVLHAFAGGAVPAQVTIAESGSVILQQTGIASSAIAGEFGGSATVDNHGLVEVQSASLSGIGFLFNGGGVFTNTGVLSVATTNGSAVGVAGDGANTINTGLIQVVGREQTFAVRGALDNSGVIRAIATHEVAAVDQEGAFHNTGRILAHCAVGGATGVRVELPMGFAFSNEGQIIATGGLGSVGVQVQTTNINPGVITHMAAETLENSGLIKAHIAVQALGGQLAASVNLNNSGTIRGDIALGDVADSIVNTGKIAGVVLLAGGDDSFSTDGGVVKGAGVLGGAGDDLLTGGKYADHLIGDSGSNDASDGADTLIGGKGADTLIGNGGADHFVYQTINDSTGAQSDLIMDLEDGDIIDLSQIDADRTQGGDQGFFFVTDFDGRAGEARMFYDSGTGLTHLELDVNGDMQADSIVLMVGDHTGFTGFAT